MDTRRRISISELAKKLGVHRNTLRHYLHANNVDTMFSDISDTDLDSLVKAFREAHPDSGLRYLIGFLRKSGLRIQRERVRSSVSRVDKLGKSLRRQVRKKVKRRDKYKVKRPNALWHIDGHHKLIKWGIVIHGCIDGYSRLVSQKISYCFQLLKHHFR